MPGFHPVSYSVIMHLLGGFWSLVRLGEDNRILPSSQPLNRLPWKRWIVCCLKPIFSHTLHSLCPTSRLLLSSRVAPWLSSCRPMARTDLLITCKRGNYNYRNMNCFVDSPPVIWHGTVAHWVFVDILKYLLHLHDQTPDEEEDNLLERSRDVLDIGITHPMYFIPCCLACTLGIVLLL